MLYSEYRKNILAGSCPFCHPDDRKFLENKTAFLTYGIAPYHKHHLLVIPKEHKISFLEFGREELDEIWDLIRKGAALLLVLGYENYTVMVREGKNTSKSIAHLHYHIIPDSRIGDLDHEGKARRVMTQEEIHSVSQEIRGAIQKLTFTGL